MKITLVMLTSEEAADALFDYARHAGGDRPAAIQIMGPYGLLLTLTGKEDGSYIWEDSTHRQSTRKED